MAETRFEFQATKPSDGGFLFVLEPEENSGKTIFEAGTSVRLKLYPGGRNPSLSASFGTVSFYLRDVSEICTEFLVFDDSRKITAGRPLKRILSAVWQGRGSGSPSFIGRTVYLPKKQTGVLKIEYETSYDIIDAVCTEPTYTVVTASTETLTGSIALDYTDGFDTGLYNRTVILTVKDACTKAVLSDAHVYLNGRYAGKSDSEGRVRLGSLKNGTYSLSVTREGYKDTGTDNVRNDSFTVG